MIPVAGPAREPSVDVGKKRAAMDRRLLDRCIRDVRPGSRCPAPSETPVGMCTDCRDELREATP